MNIEKLPSGAYRVRQQLDGKRKSVYFDHKPTEHEIVREFYKKFNETVEVSAYENISFEDAAKNYIQIKNNVLSASTIRGYEAYLRNLPIEFKTLGVGQISQLQIQAVINDLSAGHSPKYVRNLHGFISAVIRLYNPSLNISTRLPQKRVTEAVCPSDEAIKLILKEAGGTMFECFLLLACLGLRRSEILAIRYPEDFSGNFVYINKVMVQDKDKNWIIKETTKNTSSTRTVFVPDDILEKIKQQGYIYKGHPNAPLKWLGTTQKKLGLEHFSLHSFRHHFCSKLSSMNVDEATILSLGGWKTDFVMKKTYRHTMQDRLDAAKVESVTQLANAILPWAP